MSGIFIDQSDKISATVFYKESDKKIQVLDRKEDGCKSITIAFKFPDFATSQHLLQSSTIATDDGNMVDLLKLRYNILHLLAVDWDVKDDKGNPVKISSETINRLHPAIASDMINKVQGDINNSGFLTI